MIVRRIDSLGRIVIPKTFRKQLGINQDDNLSIKLTENELIVSKEIVEFDLADSILKFIINTYGLEYQDMLISKTMKKEVHKLLKEYFDVKLLRRNNAKRRDV